MIPSNPASRATARLGESRTSESGGHEHVVDRLRSRTAQARQLGFEVRAELLDGSQPDWCQLGSRRIIFLDLSQTAGEQLAQLEEILRLLHPPARQTAA